MVAKVVIDTNIYISAIFWGGKPREVVDLGRDKNILIFTSLDMEKEIAENMTKVTDIGSLIVRTPEIRGGRPRIAGTGVTVRRNFMKDLVIQTLNNDDVGGER